MSRNLGLRAAVFAMAAAAVSCGGGQSGPPAPSTQLGATTNSFFTTAMVNGQQFFVGGSFTDQNRLIVAVAGAAPETGEVSLEGGGAFTDGSVEIRQLEASKLGAKGTPVGCAVVEIVAAGKSSVYGFQVQKGDAFSNPHTPVESTLNLKPTTLTAAQADQHMRQATKPLAGGTGDSCTLAR